MLFVLVLFYKYTLSVFRVWSIELVLESNHWCPPCFNSLKNLSCKKLLAPLKGSNHIIIIRISMNAVTSVACIGGLPPCFHSLFCPPLKTTLPSFLLLHFFLYLFCKISCIFLVFQWHWSVTLVNSFSHLWTNNSISRKHSSPFHWGLCSEFSCQKVN